MRCMDMREKKILISAEADVRESYQLRMAHRPGNSVLCRQ